MKTGFKHFLCRSAFVVGLIVILIATSFLLLPKSNKEGFGMTDTLANGILGEKTGTVDVLFLGDSETYCAFSPMQLWADHGITSYVCGTSLQHLCWTENFLHRAFEKQKPAVVVLETNTIFREMTLSESVTNRVENLFSVFRYHDRWKSFHLSEIWKSSDYSWTDDNKGYRFNTTAVPADPTGYMQPTDVAAAISVLNRQYIESIAAFCEKNGAKLVLVSTPSTVNWNSQKHNGVEKLSQGLGLTYIDMNMLPKAVPIDWSKDTRDKGDHMNYFGAVKVTKYMGEYLAESGLLTDHRSDKQYAAWNESLRRYRMAIGISD